MHGTGQIGNPESTSVGEVWANAVRLLFDGGGPTCRIQAIRDCSCLKLLVQRRPEAFGLGFARLLFGGGEGMRKSVTDSPPCERMTSPALQFLGRGLTSYDASLDDPDLSEQPQG
jgi:hypothetical protein